MYETVTEVCKPCQGTGKHRHEPEYPCYNCRGEGSIKRDIIPLDEHFNEGALRWGTEQFECENCEKEWHLGDTCEVETGDYERDLYQCTCGAIMQLSTEWVSEYHISQRLYKGNE